MNNLNIDEEIDNTIDKMAEALKVRIKKLVERSEKQMLKQYIASQKETGRLTKGVISSRNTRDNQSPKKTAGASKKAPVRRNAPKREADYRSSSDSYSSDSE